MFNFSDKGKLDITVIPLILINICKRMTYQGCFTQLITAKLFKRHGLTAKYILKTDKAIKLINAKLNSQI